MSQQIDVSTRAVVDVSTVVRPQQRQDGAGGMHLLLQEELLLQELLLELLLLQLRQHRRLSLQRQPCTVRQVPTHERQGEIVKGSQVHAQ